MKVQEMFNLKEKVAIVSGGGRGIGLKMAEGLAEAGANLVICSRKVERCIQAAQELAEKNKIRSLALKCDVRSAEDIEKVVERAIREFGRIDVLVNNSGANWGASVIEYPLAGWQKVMETNVTGTFLFCKAVGPIMMAQKSGSIINIASVMGFLGTEAEIADAIAYSTSKGALITFTKDLAVKWAKFNIRVNALAPGWFPSDMSQWVIEHHRQKLLNHIPMGRFGEGEELKGCIVFLASEAARYVTGAVIPVDGGYLAV